MSKVNPRAEISAARTLHAENDIIKYIHGKRGVGPSANAWYFGRVPTAEVLAVGFSPRMSSCPGSRHSLRKLSSSTGPEGRHRT